MSRFSIQIPAPCSESWETMQPDGCGRFCASCQKTVVDYSHFSDAQLTEAFRNHTGTSSLCGRFRPEQLQRTINKNTISAGWFRWMNLFTIGLLGWQTVRAQTKPAKSAPDQSLSALESPRSEPLLVSPIASTFKDNRPSEIMTHWTISGRVIVEDSIGNQKTVSQANVSVVTQRYSRTTQTDSTGAFLLDFEATRDTTEFRLFISSKSGLFQRTTFTGNPENPSISLNTIVVYESRRTRNLVGGGICIVRRPSFFKRLWRSVF